MRFLGKAKEEFHIDPLTSEEMEAFVDRCLRIYGGHPDWVDERIKTVNFAKSVCSETARLTTLAIGVKVDGGNRAKWLQQRIDDAYFNLRHWVEYGMAAGTVILKPNGVGIDCVTPDHFVVTDVKDGEICGAVFTDQRYDPTNKKWYTRLEYHRFEEQESGRVYVISNRCFVGDSQSDSGKEIAIEKTPWTGLTADVVATNVDKPLFGVFRTPAANHIEISSPLGLPVFSDAIEELCDLDIAYSLNALEVDDSEKLTLVDGDLLLPGGGIRPSAMSYEQGRKNLGLPRYVKAVQGTDAGDFFHEIVPSLNTETRLTGINALLSQIGFKCGFSNGYFVFNEKTGMMTATQVESDDRRTIQLIKDMRDKLEKCLDGLIYALDKFADAYGLAPVGTYKVTYDFGDITYNADEDRARWLSYANAGRIPFWYYLVKFENMTESEAKALEGQAQPKETLFGGEE